MANCLCIGIAIGSLRGWSRTISVVLWGIRSEIVARSSSQRTALLNIPRSRKKDQQVHFISASQVQRPISREPVFMEEPLSESCSSKSQPIWDVLHPSHLWTRRWVEASLLFIKASRQFTRAKWWWRTLAASRTTRIGWRCWRKASSGIIETRANSDYLWILSDKFPSFNHMMVFTRSFRFMICTLISLTDLLSLGMAKGSLGAFGILIEAMSSFFKGFEVIFGISKAYNFGR